MIKLVAAVVFVFLLFSGWSATAVEAQKANEVLSLSKAQWRADLQYLATELPKRHKNLFFKISRQDFEREVARFNETSRRCRILR